MGGEAGTPSTPPPLPLSTALKSEKGIKEPYCIKNEFFSSVNVKNLISSVSCRFSHIYWRNP